MPTKLSRFCSGVMEAAWLAAVCIIPIFFDIYSSRIFEPDKISILRSLALLTLAAWTVKLIDEGGIKWKLQDNDTSLIKYLWNYPMVAPVIGLIFVYIISTIFSVTPYISLFGSYQRLQGTYTTFSYLIIFFSIVVNLRKQEQINRLVTTIILASLPISFYGLLQRFKIDPIPWGGDVTKRIASTMGNSIFVAAYLIMVFPLTIGRMIEAFKEILADNNKGIKISSLKQIIKATIYVIIGALQLIAIYMSGSRGPLLGLLAGIYFMFLLFSFYWKRRWLTIIVIGLAVVGVIFLAAFNMKNGPLEALKKSPLVGRFGNLLNSESNSALVRQYIWEGDVKLVGIHAPLKFPDGSVDKFNFLRPIIGYGPESMYVAYNQFYQPELGQVEKRNASPDRSHNETWDSLVITGLWGLLVYLLLFSSVFYYGLKWQGLITSNRDKYLFIACLLGGGLIGVIAMIILEGIEYLGVGLPFGMVFGMVLYLFLYGLFSQSQNDEIRKSNQYTPLLIVLFAAVAGHFVEINFGIAIVATRTLFWTYSGLILVVGFILPKLRVAETSEGTTEAIAEPKSTIPIRRRGKQGSINTHHRNVRNRPIIGGRPDWFRNTLVGAIIVGIVIATLGYNFITKSSTASTFSQIIVNSLSILDNKNGAFSLGILALMLITILIGILLFAVEIDESQEFHDWFQSVGMMAVISIAIGVLFWVLQAVSLEVLANFIPQTQSDVFLKVSNIGSLLAKYYLYIFFVIVLVAFMLPEEKPSRSISSKYLSFITVPVMLILLFIITSISNLNVIRADITFKMADPFVNSDQWQASILLYKQALNLAPKEDHYYLFLGRSYLEQAKITQATTDLDNLVIQAEKDLTVAQSINPLDTDHTANLARLYSWWAGKASTASTRKERAQKASDYYGTAVTLSPNNSTLWDEWAVLIMQVFAQPQQASQKLQHALNLDSKYSFTQGLLGDYYLTIANSSIVSGAKKAALTNATEYYLNAANVYKATDTSSKGNYLVSYCNVTLMSATLDPNNIDRVSLQQAIDTVLISMRTGIVSADKWKVQAAVATLYLQLGDKENAQKYAKLALATAPASATSRIQEIITQTLSLP